jgi:peptide/nickel transport system substrate-binding protein
VPPAPRRAASLLLRALLAVGLLAGCVSDPPVPGDPAERLTVLLDAPVHDLDPRFTVDSNGMKVSRLVFSALVTVDNERAAPVPDLAVAVEPDPQAPVDAVHTRWLVTLRRDVRWHDGAPFTAADVVYTYRSVLDPALGSPYRGAYARKLRDVRAVPGDPYRVVFELYEPYATFLTDLVLGIVPAHRLEPAAGRDEGGAALPGRFAAGELIGTGPFRFRSQLGARRIVLEASPDWYGGAPGVRWLVFRVIEDEGTRLLSLVGGSGDLTMNALSPVLLDVVADEPRLVVESAPGLAWTYLAFNLRDPVVSDGRVRRALDLAIDRGEVIRRKWKGHATPAAAMMSPVTWAHAADLIPTRPDPAAAEALLDAAGYRRDPTTGVRFTLRLKLSTDRFRRSVARTVVDQLAAVGVAVELRSFELGTFLADIRSGNFQATILKLPEPSEPDMLRWMFASLNTPDVQPALPAGGEGAAAAAAGDPVAAAAAADRRFFPPDLATLLVGEPACAAWARDEVARGAARWIERAWGRDPPRDRSNRTYYANPRVDCLLARGLAELDEAARKPLYDEVQRILAADLPVLPLWHEHNVVVRSRRVRGFTILPNGRFAPLAHVTLDGR